MLEYRVLQVSRQLMPRKTLLQIQTEMLIAINTQREKSIKKLIQHCVLVFVPGQKPLLLITIMNSGQ